MRAKRLYIRANDQWKAFHRGSVLPQGLGRVGRTTGAILSLAILSGCIVTPEPIGDEDRTTRATTDFSQLFLNQEPVRRAISVHDAIARALKYNLDERLKIMEKALADRRLDASQFDLLPQLTATAGYSRRNNDRASSSESVITGAESLEVSTSEDLGVRRGSLTFSWNILDFGLSYVRAKQNADEALIAEERRRKVVQNIVLDVRDAYWRAVSAERLLNPLRDLILQIEGALGKSRAAEARRLMPPRLALTFQRDLLEQLRELNVIRRRLVLSKVSLAALINLRPGENYEVIIPEDKDIVPPEVTMEVARMEMVALIDRPELREEDYRKRISQWDVRRAMLSLIPGIEFSAGGNFESNSFLANNTWVGWGTTITQNLFNYLSAPSRIKFAETAVTVADARRMALSMAIVAQVQISYRRYRVARDEETLARRIFDVDDRLTDIVQDQSNAEAVDEMELIRNRTNRMVSALRRDIAMADLQNAYGRLLNSIGVDPLPKEIAAADLETLSKSVRAALNGWTLRAEDLLDGRELPNPIIVPDKSFWEIDNRLPTPIQPSS
ncbi:MAG: multidrug efflux system outer membrane protein [Paracoccaceae bacterium]